MPKVDTVGDKYYRPLVVTETIGGALFWVISCLSIAALTVDKTLYPAVNQAVQIMFIVTALAFFALGLVQKLYLTPRAEDCRRQELLSNSYNVALTHEKTVEYYNNNQTIPLRRLAASTMESAFFTEAIAQKMLVGQRSKTIGYLTIYVVIVLNRSSNLELLAIAAQAIFSEEIIARWLRLEWLRRRSEQVFERLNRLFVSKRSFNKPDAQSEALDLFSFYETTKATAAILLSSRHFKDNNERLSADWKKIRSRIAI